ncbi:MAG: GNAT family N-acetyltransferase [Armatimonadetes bacterium]|nr:GNAT family N-acetyltransferase [Armatimonadota bacterium]
MVSVRQATVADAQAIADISVACWRWAYAHIIRPEHMAALEAVRRADRTREKLSRGETIFVAETDNGVVGFAVLQEPCSWAGADYEVSGLYVHPSAARGGIGRALVARAATYGLKQGHATLGIHTLRDNSIGRAFYERIGGTLVCKDTWTFQGVDYPAVWYLFDDLGILSGA